MTDLITNALNDVLVQIKLVLHSTNAAATNAIWFIIAIIGQMKDYDEPCDSDAEYDSDPDSETEPDYDCF